MKTNPRRPSLASVDISPEYREFLNQPSPYHDTFFEAEPFSHSNVSITSKGVGSMFSFFNRFRYSKLGEQQSLGDNAQEKDEDGSIEPFIHHRHKDHSRSSELSEGSPSDRWSTVVFLILLMSILMNLFLFWNGGAPSTLASHSAHAHKHYQPHGSFTYKDHGQNYTCYQTNTTVLAPNYDYSDTYHTHDKLWEEAQGGSKGTIYTSENRADGKVRAAGISMFHQLHCLAQIRNAIQQLQSGHRIGFSEQTDVSEHRGHWPHCFDYLRQTILCNADDSLEVSGVHNGQWSFSGYGSHRVCRDSKWLYEATACGGEGCEGKRWYHSKEEMGRVHREEAEAVEEWKKKHGQDVLESNVEELGMSERDLVERIGKGSEWKAWLRTSESSGM